MQTLASTHLALAKKNDPGLSERFNLFVKEREHSQASESDNSGEGAKDLVSIVEFQVMFSFALLSLVASVQEQCCNCAVTNQMSSGFKNLCLTLPCAVWYESVVS